MYTMEDNGRVGEEQAGELRVVVLVRSCRCIRAHVRARAEQRTRNYQVASNVVHVLTFVVSPSCAVGFSTAVAQRDVPPGKVPNLMCAVCVLKVSTRCLLLL